MNVNEVLIEMLVAQFKACKNEGERLLIVRRMHNVLNNQEAIIFLKAAYKHLCLIDKPISL